MYCIIHSILFYISLILESKSKGTQRPTRQLVGLFNVWCPVNISSYCGPGENCLMFRSFRFCNGLKWLPGSAC